MKSCVEKYGIVTGDIMAIYLLENINQSLLGGILPDLGV
jgi:hypothetical protein